MTGDSRRIAVVGAGVVGTLTARKLQQAGHEVFLFDGNPPASQCSFGNAGYIATEEVLPMARPAVLGQAPAMLLRAKGPLSIRLADFPALLPWFLRFARACGPAQVRRGSQALIDLMAGARAAWRREQEATDLSRFWRQRGMIRLYESDKKFASDREEFGIMRDAGVGIEELDRAGLEAHIGGLAPRISRGIYYPAGAHVTNPEGIVLAIFDAFVRDGGDFVQQPVGELITRDGEVRSVRGTSAEIPVDAVVIAAGQGSRPIMERMNVQTPLIAERGYHLVIDCPDIPFEMPLTSADRSFILTPMEMGLRLAGTVEFGRPGKAENWKRADVLEHHMRAMFPDLSGIVKSRWMGERPTLPDFLPAIGLAPNHRNLFCAYGHQHFGLTLSALTGEIIADLITGKKPAIDPGALDPGRFG